MVLIPITHQAFSNSSMILLNLGTLLMLLTIALIVSEF